jgi:hypothetical protein
MEEKTLIAVVVWFFYGCETWFLTWEEGAGEWGVEDIWAEKRERERERDSSSRMGTLHNEELQNL